MIILKQCDWLSRWTPDQNVYEMLPIRMMQKKCLCQNTALEFWFGAYDMLHVKERVDTLCVPVQCGQLENIAFICLVLYSRFLNFTQNLTEGNSDY